MAHEKDLFTFLFCYLNTNKYLSPCPARKAPNISVRYKKISQKEIETLSFIAVRQNKCPISAYFIIVMFDKI